MASLPKLCDHKTCSAQCPVHTAVRLQLLISPCPARFSDLRLTVCVPCFADSCRMHLRDAVYAFLRIRIRCHAAIASVCPASRTASSPARNRSVPSARLVDCYSFVSRSKLVKEGSRPMLRYFRNMSLLVRFLGTVAGSYLCLALILTFSLRFPVLLVSYPFCEFPIALAHFSNFSTLSAPCDEA